MQCASFEYHLLSTEDSSAATRRRPGGAITQHLVDRLVISIEVKLFLLRYNHLYPVFEREIPTPFNFLYKPQIG